MAEMARALVLQPGHEPGSALGKMTTTTIERGRRR
jgi:hypothetical protein